MSLESEKTPRVAKRLLWTLTLWNVVFVLTRQVDSHLYNDSSNHWKPVILNRSQNINSTNLQRFQLSKPQSNILALKNNQNSRDIKLDRTEWIPTKSRHQKRIQGLHPPVEDQLSWRFMSGLDANDSLDPFTDHIGSSEMISMENRPLVRNQILPNGPPPFRPPNFLLDLNSNGLLKQLKATQTFKKIYKSNVYYFFLDVLRQLGLLGQQIAHAKMHLMKAKMVAVQAIVNKLISKSGQALKLKWPLIMLNPKFVRQLIRDPAFLVMLFHTIESAYISMPKQNFWLKPLVRLVDQPSLEKEERVWWRRKRQYDLMNGPNSSELQPNLKSKYFKTLKQLDQARPVSKNQVIPAFIGAVRKLAGREQPDPSYYQYPSQAKLQSHNSGWSHQQDEIIEPIRVYRHSSQTPQIEPPMEDVESSQDESGIIPEQKIVTYADSKPSMQVWEASNLLLSGQHFSPNDILTQAEFDNFDQRQKESVLKEARLTLEDSRLAEELIKQQSDLIDSLSHKQVEMNDGLRHFETDSDHLELQPDEFDPLSLAEGAKREVIHKYVDRRTNIR